MQALVPNTLPLLDALNLLFPASSKNTLRSWIREGRVYVNEEPCTHPASLVVKNQRITIGQRKKTIRRDLPILYEDEDFVVIDKPSGLLSVAAAFEKEETVHALLKSHYRKRHLYVVHRLDQDASGALLFAFNETIYERLKALFAAHAIERTYIAIVEGPFPSTSGTWESYLREDNSYKVHAASSATQGQRAVTHYRLLASDKRYSWLELKLETGRKNQIRVHCESAGYSIVGDKKYGARTNPLKRLCLHAHLLGFQHPFTKKPLTFTSPIPETFHRLRPQATSLHLSTLLD